MHRDWFRDEVLAELLPPLEPDGTSHLWNALGRKFTEMTYAEADRLSKKNKEFIKGLFPEGAVYASLLPADAQEVIGKVGAQSKGVERMLRRVGFRYAWRVDPFDGGPHFTAPTDEVTLVQLSHAARVTSLRDSADVHEVAGRRALVARESNAPPFFRAIVTAWHPGDTVKSQDGRLRSVEIGRDGGEDLGVGVNDDVWVLPLE
jgi:arginine N-succinyltransferase